MAKNFKDAVHVEQDAMTDEYARKVMSHVIGGPHIPHSGTPLGPPNELDLWQRRTNANIYRRSYAAEHELRLERIRERVEGAFQEGANNIFREFLSQNENEIREAFGLEPPRFSVSGGNIITDDLEDSKSARYRMKNWNCLKCRQKTLGRGFSFSSMTPYCHKCFDSSKERIVSDWMKRHEHLSEVREMRRRGADTEEMLLFIRRRMCRRS